MAGNVGPFAGLDEAALRELAPHGATRSFPKNVVRVHEGDNSDALFVLLSGRVNAFVSEDDGKQAVVGTTYAGDFFGELVLDGGPRSASIITLEPCRCYIIPRADIEGLLEQQPKFARALICRLIGRVRSLTQAVRVLALKDVYGRLAKFIEDNAVEQSGKRVIADRLTQSDIAARIGCAREMVSRIIKDLTTGGYISVDGRQIIVHKKLPAKW